jgi:hypothetical protein
VLECGISSYLADLLELAAIPAVGIRERNRHVHPTPLRHLIMWKMNQPIEQNVDAKVEVILRERLVRMRNVR